MVHGDGQTSEAELAAFADGSLHRDGARPAVAAAPSPARRMTERRRSLFVLLLVLGLIAASISVLNQRDTKLGLDLQGGVQLVYEAEATAQQPTVTPEALQRALDIMRERVDALGVSEPELLQSGEHQIEVNLPGVENAERAAQQVGSTAQLFFYDWEASILDENCRTDPNENANEKQ